jgi:hypothetical protein
VQGRLRDEYLSVEVSSECAHCRKPMHITIDSDLNYQVKEHGCEPIVFAPDVDFSRLEDRCIIHAF